MVRCSARTRARLTLGTYSIMPSVALVGSTLLIFPEVMAHIIQSDGARCKEIDAFHLVTAAVVQHRPYLTEHA